MGTLNTQDGHSSAYPRSNIFLEVESGKNSNKIKKNIKICCKSCIEVHHCCELLLAINPWCNSKNVTAFDREKETEYLICFSQTRCVWWHMPEGSKHSAFDVVEWNAKIYTKSSFAKTDKRHSSNE